MQKNPLETLLKEVKLKRLDTLLKEGPAFAFLNWHNFRLSRVLLTGLPENDTLKKKRCHNIHDE